MELEIKREALKYIALVIICFVITNAEAQIEYYNLSPDTTVFSPADTNGINYYSIDINRDGTVDFELGAGLSLDCASSRSCLERRIVFITSDSLCKISVGPYYEGNTIDQNNYYENQNWIYSIFPGMGVVGTWPVGGVQKNEIAYIGLQILDQGNLCYGWLRLKTDGESFTVMAYAWNRTPGQSITVGQIQ